MITLDIVTKDDGHVFGQLIQQADNTWDLMHLLASGEFAIGDNFPDLDKATDFLRKRLFPSEVRLTVNVWDMFADRGNKTISAITSLGREITISFTDGVMIGIVATETDGTPYFSVSRTEL